MAKALNIKTLEQKWDNADKWVKRIIGGVTTLATIAGMFIGLFNWGIGQLDNYVDDRISQVTAQVEELQTTLDTTSAESRLSRTRLELSNLIAHNPTNVAQIEMIARYYFVDLGGDWYMSGIYSNWAKEYGGDISFVIHKE